MMTALQMLVRKRMLHSKPLQICGDKFTASVIRGFFVRTKLIIVCGNPREFAETADILCIFFQKYNVLILTLLV